MPQNKVMASKLALDSALQNGKKTSVHSSSSDGWERKKA